MVATKHTHEIVDVNPKWHEGVTKWFNGCHGFVQVPGFDKDVHVHFSALPLGKDGRPIEPTNERPIRVQVGRGLKDGVEVGPAVAKADVIHPFIRKVKKTA